jgi:hypothetical protein
MTAFFKPPKVKADPEYLAAIHAMPCWICTEWGMTQASPTQAHHTIHGRYGNRRTPDRQAIPLCEGHHQGLRDTTKIALHREPDRWKAEYGLDTDWIARTQDIIGDAA